jgi:hypothetical protein
MASSYKRIFKKQTYTYAGIMTQIYALKRQYEFVEYKYDYKKKKFNIFMKLKPTEDSITYTVELISAVGRKSVDVFVRNPDIEEMAQGRRIPHRYGNKELCLHYPEYNEWKYSDMWADTIVPWTCLWLYYFELWIATGEWLGGGKH